MKAFTFVFVFLMVGAAAFMYLDYSHKKGNSSNPGKRSVFGKWNIQ